MANRSKRKSKPSKKAWIIIHIILPLTPFFLGGFINLCARGLGFFTTAFSASTLAMSSGLLCMFVNQSLLNSQHSLSNSSSKDDIHGTATLFLIFAIIGFAFFAILVLLSAIYDLGANAAIEKVYRNFRIWGYIFPIVPIFFAIRAQGSYKLKANIS